MSGIRIIRFHEAQQPGIDQLMRGIAGEFAESFHSPDAKSIRELAQLPGENYWTAFHGAQVVGTIGLLFLQERQAVLKRMFIAKDFRGKKFNLAVALLQTALDHARKNNVQRVSLGTMKQFVAAQKFYLREGFREIGPEKLPPGFVPNPVDTVFFSRDLSPGTA